MVTTSSQQCLIVLGMHRSGTSCLTGIVEQCGVSLGEVFTQNPFNLKGNRESSDIQALNNDVLAMNEGAWNDPVEVTVWNTQLEHRRDEIIATLEQSGESWWGFKDPRTVLTLPFWLERLESPKFLGTFRHPHRVALSLHQRDRMPLDEAYMLWRSYNEELLHWQERYEFELVDFDLSAEDYRQDVSKKLQNLGLSASGTVFFEDGLRHQVNESVNVDLPTDVAEVYGRLKRVHGAH